MPREIRGLIAFDRKAFSRYPADWFSSYEWEQCTAWWLLVNGRKIGCCAFSEGANFDFESTPDLRTSPQDCLYIVSSGLLPEFQGTGFGSLMKAWQICYAREHGYTRILTNSRKSNAIMRQLNRKFGFREIRSIPAYYSNPTESTVIMELLLERP